MSVKRCAEREQRPAEQELDLPDRRRQRRLRQGERLRGLREAARMRERNEVLDLAQRERGQQGRTVGHGEQCIDAMRSSINGTITG